MDVEREIKMCTKRILSEIKMKTSKQLKINIREYVKIGKKIKMDVERLKNTQKRLLKDIKMKIKKRLNED